MRHEIRAAIACREGKTRGEDTLLLMSESFDDYIEHQLESDKVLVGILKDIQGNTAIMAEKLLQNLITGNLN